MNCGLSSLLIENSLFTRLYLRQFQQGKCWSSLSKYNCYTEFFVRVGCEVRSRYLLSKKKILCSGDVELIPGPAEAAAIPTVL